MKLRKKLVHKGVRLRLSKGNPNRKPERPSPLPRKEIQSRVRLELIFGERASG
jgi:hypothetical protein